MRRRKSTLIIFIIANYITVFGQEIKLNHFPTKTSEVSDEEYRKGKYILTNSYQAIKEDSGKMVYADYWNVAVGSALMGENKEVIFKLLETSKIRATSEFCQLVQQQIDMKNGATEETRFYRIFGDRYVNLISDCKSITSNRIDNELNPKFGVDLANLNVEIIDSLLTMMERDQKFRHKYSKYFANTEEQSKLDKLNQVQLELIFLKYGYPGRSIVGDKFMNHACLIFEHGGDLEFQEKYLSLITDGLKSNQVDKSVVRMLIDRIHWKKTGKQIFGSQVGVPFDNDNVIQGIKETYKL